MPLDWGQEGFRLLSDVTIGQSYSTSEADLIRDFYLPCLAEATTYDRAVGYFRASLFAIVGVALSDFAERGGIMRLICSPSLKKEDAEAILAGIETREVLDNAATREVRLLLQDPRNLPVTSLLATLISLGSLELRIAHRPMQSGIFHAKIGVLSDGENTISFSGSSNETFSAWDRTGNYESFEVFRSWDDDSSADRVSRHRARFERLWNGDESGVETMSFPEAARRDILRFQDERGLVHALGAVRDEALKSLPRTGSGDFVVGSAGTRILMKHQTDVLDEWTAASYCGIVKHATGAGKTVTALEAIRRWTSESRPSVVVVPSEILVRQWLAEAETEFGPSVALLQAGAGEGIARWTSALPDHTRDDPDLGPRLTIATIQTASSPTFRGLLQGGEHLLLVIDEVHRSGAPTFSRVLEIEAGGRLGLSATPERYGDPDGTRRILDYFGGILKPEFGLQDAIDAGRLVPYDYHVHRVALDAWEMEEWKESTQRIRDAYARLPAIDGAKVLTNAFKLMLIQRSRIAKKAAAKVSLAHDVLRDHYSDGDSWLIYCDDTDQLDLVAQAIDDLGLSPLVYHSSMAGAQAETLEYFARNRGVLVAIKCLDEGVDIPSVNAALVLASSTNPREFIQRRGRVLRKDVGKHSAVVRDALVVPDGTSETGDDTATLIRTELRRALEFARGARNAGTLHELQRLAREIGISLDEAVDMDFEDEDHP